MPTIAILGASTDRSKFGNKAVRVFIDKGYQVFPVNPKEKTIEGLTAYPSISEVPVSNLDMVSFYLPPAVGLKVIAEVAKKGAKEVWLNPGAESRELVEKAEALGLNVIEACSIVAVGSSPSLY